ncbi:MAG: DUF3110 domain-containing protein [Synechococcales bacterium]|nr:DUF3110 domain-containing protein [Synechococcales bacterium]
MRVFVLLFHAGTENEGIHTISIGHRNIVLMFEDEDDATRYALLLEAQDFPEPSVEPIQREEVEEFCQEARYECKFIPRDFTMADEEDRLLLMPPERNVGDFDWDANEKRPMVSAEPDAGEMSQDELEALRRKFEGLL